MKYENFEQARNLVEQIKKHQLRLESISTDSVTVIVNSSETFGRVFTIGAYSSYEHEYTQFAITFIGRIKVDLMNRIENLKSMLSEL